MSCHLATFGSPAVVTLMTSAPVSSIATSWSRAAAHRSPGPPSAGRRCRSWLRRPRHHQLHTSILISNYIFAVRVKSVRRLSSSSSNRISRQAEIERRYSST